MKNAVHIGGIDGGGETLAFAYTCYFSDGSSVFVDSVQIKFDQAEDWYKQNDTPVPSGQIDAESVATHEFGHETGWRDHFNAGADICDHPGDEPWHTMCPLVPSGTSFWRSLEEHDRHTFNAEY